MEPHGGRKSRKRMVKLLQARMRAELFRKRQKVGEWERWSSVSSTHPALRHLAISETAHWITHKPWLLLWWLGKGREQEKLMRGRERAGPQGPPGGPGLPALGSSSFEWVISNMGLAWNLWIDWLHGERNVSFSSLWAHAWSLEATREPQWLHTTLRRSLAGDLSQ